MTLARNITLLENADAAFRAAVREPNAALARRAARPPMRLRRGPPGKRTGGPFLCQRAGIFSQVETPDRHPAGHWLTFGTAGAERADFGTQKPPLWW